MKPSELEAKVLAIVDRIANKQPVEDSFVELKAEWTEPKKAGRQLAGLCNAARGEQVLWIVGLDERRGAIGADHAELSDWWAQVTSQFDQQPPTLIHSLTVRHGPHTLVALLVDSERAPFVTRNPSGGEVVSLEVPWREGNATRSARRQDLLRILVPAVRLPDLELLSMEAEAFAVDPGVWHARVDVSLYAIARTPAILIAHRSEVRLAPEQFTFVSEQAHGFTGDSLDGITISDTEVVLNRPGRFSFTASGRISGIGPVLPSTLSAEIDFAVVDANTRPCVAGTLSRVHGTSATRVPYR